MPHLIYAWVYHTLVQFGIKLVQATNVIALQYMQDLKISLNDPFQATWNVSHIA